MSELSAASTVPSATVAAAQRKVHFNEDTKVQFLGEFTCIRSVDDLPEKQALEEESSFVSCLAFGSPGQFGHHQHHHHQHQSSAAPVAFVSSTDHLYGTTSSSKHINPDILMCSSGEHSGKVFNATTLSHQQHQYHENNELGPATISYTASSCISPLAVAHHHHLHPNHTTTALDPEDIGFCQQQHHHHCDLCNGGSLANSFMAKISASDCSSGDHQNHQQLQQANCSAGDFATAGSNSTQTNGQSGSNFYSFVPFLLVTGILSITLALLVSVSIIYIQYLPLQDKANLGFEDFCDESSCAFGSQCIYDDVSKVGSCQCDSRTCEGHEDTGQPVCGDDNQTYSSECALKLASCSQQRAILVRLRGNCDPCDGVECPTNQVCQLDESRNPICRCNAVCSLDFKPICGSDGKSYTNECVLRVEACKAKKSLRILYNGECGSGKGTNPCESLQCSPHQECDIDRYGIATCICPDPCPPILRPVCGSDSTTYDNECELRRKACLEHKQVSLAYRGNCEEEGPCHGFVCQFGAVCVIKSAAMEAECECPTCSEEFKPACGSDGVSYSSECKLLKESCEQQKHIELAYQGVCSGCENKNCEHYSRCETDGKGEARCSCPSNCLPTNSPVCGTDGIGYANECEMRVGGCNKKQYVMVATRGICDLCFGVHCKYGARCENGRCVCPLDCPDTFEPVCSSEGFTYTNECQMRRTACQNSLEITVSFYGDCEEAKNTGVSDISSGGYVKTCDHNTCRYGGVCDYSSDGVPHCICSYHCPSGGNEEESTCGSDGRLYENECKMQEEACRRQQEIKPHSHRLCEDTKVLPCDGESPLIDLATGKEYFCGEGPGFKQCPASSYCHKTLHFSKCCREVAFVRSCAESMHGCCPDGKTPAQGSNSAGCPSLCNCNRLGAYSLTCDPASKQCHCKPGVGGQQCERCEPGFWGLQKISEGNSGCIPCSCNESGSARDDCEQMTGRCVCKPGLQGMKCNVCPDGAVLVSDGCLDVSLTRILPGTCAETRCKFGAVCKERPGRGVQCSCDHIKCPVERNGLVARRVSGAVCGSDGNSYSSECHLRMFSCRMQRKTVKLHDDRCKPAPDTATVGPVRRSTVFKTTLQDTDKSTRELPLSVSEQISIRPTAATPNLPEKPTDSLSFTGDSYLELPRVQAYTRLTLELEFVTFAESGIVLYNGQTATGDGDFVSLSIKGGFVEFRFNLGSGTTILRSVEKIKTASTVKVVARRYLRDGTLTVDGQEDVSGRSEGDLKSLDLAEKLFLGYVPSKQRRIFENIGVKQGFVGCIHKLRVGTKDIELKVGALQCDRCEPGFLGLQKILEGYSGCTPCSCNDSSSSREDCEQMSGRCDCKPELQGMKCNVCPDGAVLVSDGCLEVSLTRIMPGTCADTRCNFGAVCKERPGRGVQCSCDHITCPVERSGLVSVAVCGSDGYSYASDCHLRMFSCRMQRKTVKLHDDRCKPSHETVTAGSVHFKTTQQDMDTRELSLSVSEQINTKSTPASPTLPDEPIDSSSFSGDSYLELPRIHAYSRLTLEVEFVTFAESGILLYNGQTATGEGDFVSLSIKGGYVEFRFNLGSGTTILRSADMIETGRPVRVVAKRYLRDGTLTVEGQDDVAGRSEGDLNSLDLADNLFVGYVPSNQKRIFENIGVKQGLVGYIHKMRVGTRDIDLKFHKV